MIKNKPTTTIEWLLNKETKMGSLFSFIITAVLIAILSPVAVPIGLYLFYDKYGFFASILYIVVTYILYLSRKDKIKLIGINKIYTTIFLFIALQYLYLETVFTAIGDPDCHSINSLSLSLISFCILIISEVLSRKNIAKSYIKTIAILLGFYLFYKTFAVVTPCNHSGHSNFELILSVVLLIIDNVVNYYFIDALYNNRDSIIKDF